MAATSETRPERFPEQRRIHGLRGSVALHRTKLLRSGALPPKLPPRALTPITSPVQPQWQWGLNQWASAGSRFFLVLAHADASGLSQLGQLKSRTCANCSDIAIHSVSAQEDLSVGTFLFRIFRELLVEGECRTRVVQGFTQMRWNLSQQMDSARGEEFPRGRKPGFF
jgi:hypothetical protein